SPRSLQEREMTSRRQFLTGLAGMGAGAVLARHHLIAQAPDAARRIDVHYHFTSPLWLAQVRAAGIQQPWGMWTPAKALEEMDKAGTAIGMLSVTTPGVWYDEAEGLTKLVGGAKSNDQSRKLARDVNEFGAKMVSDNKGRFGLWAALPVGDVDGSLQEVTY